MREAATKLSLKDAYIKTLPVARILLTHYTCRLDAAESQVHNHLNRLEQTELLSAALRSYKVPFKSVAASCLEDLLTIIVVETLDLTSEVLAGRCCLELLTTAQHC
jgi:hypothetical protein